MAEFIYNEDTRIHTLAGKIIPSVSNIVNPLSMDYSKAHPGKLERKRNLGIAFHECISLFLGDNLDEDSIDEELVIPMRQFKEFWLEDENVGRNPIITSVEKPFCHEKLKYCGKPDMVTEDTIYDWKLRKYDPIADPLRMAGYAGLVGDFPPKRKIVVEFSLDGGYRVHDADKKQAWSFFRLLLERFHKNKEWDLKIEQWRKSC